LAADALLAAPHCRGRVLAVHPRALNLSLDIGAMIALLPAATPLHPWGICIRGYASAFSSRLVQTEVEICDGTLTIGDTSISHNTLKVEELTLARRPRIRPPRRIAELLACISAGSASSLLPPSALSGAGPGGRTRSTDPVPSLEFENFLTGILDRFCRDRDTAPLAALVGLGTGLTPSGDDILVGVLSGLDFLLDCDLTAANSRRSLVASLPVPLESHTPRLSAQMLRAAAEGRYPELLLALCDALTHCDDGTKKERLLGTESPIEYADGTRSGRGTYSGADRSPFYGRRSCREVNSRGAVALPDGFCPVQVDLATRALLTLGHDSGHRFLQGFSAAILLGNYSPQDRRTTPPQLPTSRGSIND